jgi:hypothetical protein
VKRLCLLALVLLFPACGTNPKPCPPFCPTPTPTPTPTPEPTPTPAPTPPPLDPLRFEGGAFIPHITGATLCCDDPATDVDEGIAWGWPLVGEEMADHYASAGVQMTEIRPGYFAEDGYDILPKLRETVERLLARKVYALVGLIDVWPMKHGLSWPGDTCSVTHEAPQQRHLDWVKAVVEATKEYPNVVYFDGNETFDCDASVEWVEGIYFAARAAGATQLIGSNAYLGISDFQIDHGFSTPASGHILIESDNEPRSCNDWLSMKRLANGSGGYVLLWKAEMSDAEFLSCLPQFVAEDGEDAGGGEPEGECPKVARQGMGNVPHNIVGDNHIWDTTTRFGSGNGQPCNDEHHEYCDQFVGLGKGARCEPFDTELNLDVSVSGMGQCGNPPCWEQQGNRFQIRIKGAPASYTIKVCFGGGNHDKWGRPLSAGAGLDVCTERSYSQ